MADTCRLNHSEVDLSSACCKVDTATELDSSSVAGERLLEFDGLGDERVASAGLSFSSPQSMHDIIEHEYALVESIPDDDRAALMPIIRFVCSTLQDPFMAPMSSLQGGAIDVNDRSRMLKRQVNGTQASAYKDMEMMPQSGYDFDGAGTMNSGNVDWMVGIYRESMPWQRLTQTEARFKHCRVQGPQSQKDLQSVSPTCPPFELWYPPPRSMETLCGNYASQPQEQQHGFSFCSHEVRDPSLPTSLKFTDHESELSSILSGIDMESFHLEELRKSLRPSHDGKDTDVNDMDSVDASNYGDGAYGGDDDGGDGSGGGDGVHDYDDDDDDMDEGDEGLFAYHPYGKTSHASGMAWHSYWGNNLQYYPTPPTANLLQFPKLHCRRRNVIKKAVGWVKKGAALSFASRVRHERRCNLPCCMGCEAGRKRRKVSPNGAKKCIKLSMIIKSSPSTATYIVEKTDNLRQGSKENGWEVELSASYETSVDKKASEVTRDWANSPLKAALILLLTESRSRCMTPYEAMQGLVQHGYSKIIGSDSQALAGHIKTALKECPEFKELKNHRFTLRDRRQLDSSTQQCMINALRAQASSGEPHFVPSIQTEPSMSQEGCSQDLAKTLAASPSCTKLCQKQDQGKISRCRKTDGKHWRCIRHAKPGFLYCERHQPSRGRTDAHSSHENKHVSDRDDVSAHDGGTEAAAKEEELSETVVDSCSGQSVEHDTEEAEPTRCCRTDGRKWQCSNQAEEGSLYCEHHRSRCKKGMAKVHWHRPPISENAKQLREAQLPQQMRCNPSVSKFSMRLRPRRNVATAL